MRGHKVGRDAIINNNQHSTVNFRQDTFDSLGGFSKSFWIMAAITVSFVLSQSYLIFAGI